MRPSSKRALLASLLFNAVLLVAFWHSSGRLVAQATGPSSSPAGRRRHLATDTAPGVALAAGADAAGAAAACGRGGAAGAAAACAGGRTEEECAQHGKCVFIVATGRSGSTNLMDALNQIPGVLVRGENSGLFNWLLDVSTTLRDMYGFPNLPEVNPSADPRAQYEGFFAASIKPAWFSGFPRGMDSCVPRWVFRRLYSGPGLEDYVVGFKEIRYGPGGTSPPPGFTNRELKRYTPGIVSFADFERHMGLLRSLCGDARLVFNMRRDAAATAASGHNKNVRGAGNKLAISAHWFHKYATKYPGHSFTVMHEDMFNPAVNATMAADLVRFLGRPPANISFARVQRDWCCD